MKRFLIIIVVLALLVPGALWAQEEGVTLESLSDRLADFEDRLARVEALFADPWSPDVIYTDDGTCQSPVHTEEGSGWQYHFDAEVHQATADAYRAQYGVSIAPNDVYLSNIAFNVDSSHVYLRFGKRGTGRSVVETWANCKFLDHSEWIERTD